MVSGTEHKGAASKRAISTVLLAAKAVAGRDGTGASIVVEGIAALGVASMAIYVAHVIFTAAVRIAIQRLGGADIFVHCVLGTAAGLVGPYALFYVARVFNMRWQAGFGDAPHWLRVAYS